METFKKYAVFAMFMAVIIPFALIALSEDCSNLAAFIIVKAIAIAVVYAAVKLMVKAGKAGMLPEFWSKMTAK